MNDDLKLKGELMQLGMTPPEAGSPEWKYLRELERYEPEMGQMEAGLRQRRQDERNKRKG